MVGQVPRNFRFAAYQAASPKVRSIRAALNRYDHRFGHISRRDLSFSSITVHPEMLYGATPETASRPGIQLRAAGNAGVHNYLRLLQSVPDLLEKEQEF